MTTTELLAGRSRVAVVGSGIAGLTAAYLLSPVHDVTIFEADDRLGGHAHTQLFPVRDGQEIPVDTGFIVHNDRTYPTLLQLFAELDIATQQSDMSMSVASEITGLEYAGALGLGGLFPSARNVMSGRHLAMLLEVKRFHRLAREVLAADSDDVALLDFVRRAQLSPYFVDNFLIPLVAAVWSCDPRTAGDYPARYLFRFLDHHGMLTVFGSPTWRTVSGGSIKYVQEIARRIQARGATVHTGTRVHRIRESQDGVHLRCGAVEASFDAVVLAAHPHQSLEMLDQPTEYQRGLLGALRYAVKHAVLHSDESLLPRASRARASWNYQIRDDGDEVAVTYDLTRLMRLPTGDRRALVTMGRTDLVQRRKIVAEMTYEHPVYDLAFVAAQERLPEISSDRVAFAGAYHGWGFHEDGAASGAVVAAALGGRWHSGEPIAQARR